MYFCCITKRVHKCHINKKQTASFINQLFLPVLPATDPLALHMASISSNMMMWRPRADKFIYVVQTLYKIIPKFPAATILAKPCKRKNTVMVFMANFVVVKF